MSIYVTKGKLLLKFSPLSNNFLFRKAHKRGEKVNTKQNRPFPSFACQTSENRHIIIRTIDWTWWQTSFQSMSMQAKETRNRRSLTSEAVINSYHDHLKSNGRLPACPTSLP